MERKTLDATALLRSLCALFTIVCILLFILPHIHDCGGDDCPLCVLKRTFSDIFFGICFFGISHVLIYFVGNFTYFLKQSAPLTLVQLKVKLSD